MKSKITLPILLVFLSQVMLANIAPPFWSENFAAGMPANWNSGDETGNGMVWDYCDHYFDCSPNDATFQLLNIFTDERFQSNSVGNGYVYVRPYDQGSSLAPHRTYIQSPVIDCSDKSKVFLRFQTLLIAGQSQPDTAAIVQVRVGAIGPWTDFPIFENLNSELLEPGPFGMQTYNPQTIWLDISGIAGNQTGVQIRWLWKFTGDNEFFWGLDDIELLAENPVYDRTIWGQLSGQGDFAGGLNGWTVTGAGDCDWNWDADALVGLPDSDARPDFYGCSPTATNGVAVMNASYCFPDFSRSDLVSPVIDLSSVPTDQRVGLRFHQTGKVGNPNPEGNVLPVTSVMVSLDGGLSYSDTIDVNPIQPFQQVFCETKTIPLPFEASGNAQVRIRFVFSGQVTFWMIDDVRLVEQFDRDLLVRPNFFSVSPNFSTPDCVVRPFGFAAEVENVGNLEQDITTLFAWVMDEASQEIVFRDTLELGLILPGEIISDTTFEKQFTPPPVPASYACFYQVKSDLGDQDTLNNSVRWRFEVTDGLYSKNGNRHSINGAFAPFSDVTYEVGNCFFIPPGSGVKATEISFAFGNANRLFGSTLRTNLYVWKNDDSFADENGDTLVNLNERTPITQNLYSITGDEGLRDIITIPISFEDDPVLLDDSTYYLVTVEYNDPLFNPNTGQYEVFFIAGSEEINYGSMFWQSFRQPPPSYVSMLRLGNDDFFRANSWGLMRVPYVQLHLEKVINATAEFSQNIELAAFPNPTSGQLRLELGEQVLTNGAILEITDIWGRTVERRPIDAGIVSHLPIDVSHLSNGSYILRVISERWSGSAKIVVAHGE